MLVYMFAFAKKKNSTAIPLLADGTRFDMQLKEETSVLEPSLIINPATTGMPNPFSPSYFNYAFIPTFSRYYFINDYQYINGLWVVYLSVDVLASFKSAIGNLSEYVTRSASAEDTSISDKMYPVTTNYAVTKTSLDLGLDSTGFYVIGIISNSSSVSEGAISYYIMTATEMANFKAYLMSETFLTANGLNNLQEINKEMIKVLYNPYQYLVSCKFFPLAYPSSTGTAVTAVNFGWWNIPITARQISGLCVFTKQSQTFTAPAHPQASRGRYLNHAPYTEIYLTHPMIGTIVLDSNKIEATNTVIVSITADAISGQGVIDITNTTRGIRLYENVLNFAQDIPLAQINTDVIGLARTAVNSAGSIISGAVAGGIAGAIAGPVGAAVGGVLGAIVSSPSEILNCIEASIPILQGSGVNGNKANYYFSADIYVINRQIVNEDKANRGRPLCQVKTLSTLSGFILCADAHIDSIVCYDTERSLIKSFLEAGFYYE